MKIRTIPFGVMPGGAVATLFVFESAAGLEVSITNYGGIISSVRLPDRNGKKEEITAGFGNLNQYLDPHPYFGAIVGRYAGRISKGILPVDKQIFQLEQNSDGHHLHGGTTGFHTKLWEAELDSQTESASLRLRYLSPHLDGNYPGNLQVEARYLITDDNRIQLEFTAVTDRPTHLNLTNHAYFNLNAFRADVGDHSLKINAQRFVELNENLLPTGRLLNLEGTVFDFRQETLLRNRAIPSQHELDHCFVLDTPVAGEPALECRHEASGRRIRIFTSQPGIQVYSGNFLDGSLIGHHETIYTKHSAICFETQHFADSPNQPAFPGTLLREGEVYRESTTYIFDNF